MRGLKITWKQPLLSYPIHLYINDKCQQDLFIPVMLIHEPVIASSSRKTELCTTSSIQDHEQQVASVSSDHIQGSSGSWSIKDRATTRMRQQILWFHSLILFWRLKYGTKLQFCESYITWTYEEYNHIVAEGGNVSVFYKVPSTN